MESLREESKPKILVNTFDSLEPEALTAIPNIEMVAIGPLLPPEILTESESVKDETSYSLWLDSKAESSVIYVSFGTMVELSKKQIEELARALIQGKRPFLWVITDKPNREAKIDGEEEIEMEKIAALRHELEEVGMIVTWCSQVEVLRHRSVGCLEQVMEENKAKELRGNAEKWKRLAVGEGGSLDKNTVAFVKEILSEAKGKG